MWDSISRETLGDEHLKNELIKANSAYRNIYVFSAGIKLVIPDVSPDNNESDNLPPWKQVNG